jgi:hypothetical protein
MAMFEDLHTGDFILTGKKAQGIVSLAIKLGSYLRHYPAPARRYSHTALIISELPDDDYTICEAHASGVNYGRLSKYRPEDITVIRAGVGVHDAQQIKLFAQEVVKAKSSYGYLTFAGLALYCLTGTKLCLQTAGTAICSGFVADALTRAGFVWPRPPYSMMPADLAVYFHVTEAE